MNYGKSNLSRRKKQISSKKKRKKKRVGVRFFKALIICFLLLIVIGAAGVGIYVKKVIDNTPEVTAKDIMPQGYTTNIVDSNGTLLEQLKDSDSNRVYKKYDEISPYMGKAFVAIEDERFYKHNGIDIQGIIRAGVNGVAHGFHFTEGASTLTQQLIKNNVFPNFINESKYQRIERKIQEQYLALKIEKEMSKEEILEAYMNTINLGQGCLGVQTAAQRYFNKDAKDLTLSECAVIAAITQSPSNLNPVSNPENNAKRREKVLKNMKEQGFITKEEYDEAMADNVYDRIQLVNVELQDSGTVTSYFVDELTDQVIHDLVEQKGYTETQAYKALYQSGLTIYSTQDMDIQKIADEEINNQDNYQNKPKVSFSYRVSIKSADGSVKNYSEQTMLSFYKDSSNPHYKSKNYSINFATEEDAAAAIEQYKADLMVDGDEIVDGSEVVLYNLQPQASMTIIDQTTGEVKALVGGRGEKTGSKTLNRATDTTRQPGSTFKIVASYAAALDAGGLTLASVQDDAPYVYAGTEGKSVSNYDHRYRGFTTLREAITDSINIVTVKTLSQIGVSLGWQYVQDFGFTTVDSRDMNESLALGGITMGVSNLELTAAYAAIANQGTYIKPKFYTKILDHNGNVLIDNTSNQSHTVIKDTTAWLLTSAMEDVMTSGTGTSAYFGTSMPQAGKSGTTTSSRDCLFAGYTPYYTCAVWGGYDDNAVQKGSDINYPKRIWKAVMKRVHENLAYKDFTKPAGIVAVAVCKESGKLPIEGVCDHDPRGNCVITEYFAQGTEPTEYCDHHTVANICSASGMLAGSYCPAETVTTGVYIIGGTETTEDAPYLLTEAFLSQTCNVHNATNSTYTGTYAFPSVSPTNPAAGDTSGSTDPNIPDPNMPDPNEGL